MAYGTILSDTLQSSTAGVPPQFNDGSGTQVGTLCRAWVNFNGSGNIRAAFNVSSVTVVSTGTYTVNFTTAFTDTNYTVIGMSTLTTGSVGGVMALGANSGGTPNTLTTSAVGVATINSANGAASTLPYNYVAVFR